MNCCISINRSEFVSQNLSKLMKILKVLGCTLIVLAGVLVIFDLWSAIFMIFSWILTSFMLISRNWQVCVGNELVLILALARDSLCVLHRFMSKECQLNEFGIVYLILLLRFPVMILAAFYTFILYKELKAATIESIDSVTVVMNYGSTLTDGERETQASRYEGPCYKI